jgi:3-hydroxy-9,10-secoandrosta-1,3,5(10)-triene-9,17-dione monooxygenase
MFMALLRRYILIFAVTQLLDGATTLAETWASRALETEQLGRLPDASVAQLLELGIARVLVPRQWGGLELEFQQVIDALTAIARNCMSTAWCAALYAEHPWILAHFDERAQTDVWANGPDVPVCMSVAALGMATHTPDGFELEGTWPFVSGCDHAAWFMLATNWDDAAGQRMGLCLVPRADVEIDHASWRVAGLRGTGSKTLSVRRARVPTYRMRHSEALVSAPLFQGRSTPPLFCQPFGGSLGLVLAAIAVGGAEGALQQFRARALQRVLRYQNRVQAADPAAQLDLAEATLRVTSARLLLEDACEIVRAAGERSEQLSVDTLAELRARKAFVVRLCTEAIDRLFASSGGGALQDTNPLQRQWRDVHAIQAHAGMNWSAHGQNYGGIAVGLEPTIRRPW